MEPVGIYISVPFCRAKCTFCNFASDAFGSGRMDGYVDRLCEEIAEVRARTQTIGALLPERVDTLYFGGGTPSLLESPQVRRIFDALQEQFLLDSDAEMTLECAPGQLEEATLAAMLESGVNRVSLGVQSFVDAEAAAVGRLHTRAMCLEEIARLRTAGVEKISVDLIAGLPLQAAESWRFSLDELLESDVGHASIYMLEVDEESRLGREAMRGGARYSAAALPADEAVTEWYLESCERLDAAGMRQYEISNFARIGEASRHNARYWLRRPYIGFGLDAHSMLLREDGNAVRFQNGDELEGYMAKHEDPFGLRKPAAGIEMIGSTAAFEEAVFLGMRMNQGVDLRMLGEEYGPAMTKGMMDALRDVLEAGWVWHEGSRVGLTAQGRVISNEVFERVLVGVS